MDILNSCKAFVDQVTAESKDGERNLGVYMSLTLYLGSLVIL